MIRPLQPVRYGMDLDRTFAELMQRRFGGDLGSPNRRDSGDDVLWIPSIDASARGDDLVIRAELPGIDPQRDLEISVEDGVLTIRGERREQRREERDRAIRTETIYGSFLRTVPLPNGVRPEDIRATYTDGILEVVVPNGARTESSTRVPVSVEAPEGSDMRSGGDGGSRPDESATSGERVRQEEEETSR